jgi:transcription elongation factor Elf1
MAQIVYEALQFCKIVPNRIEKDIRELEHAIDLYSQLQDRCDRHNAIIGVPIPGGTGGSNMGTQEDTIENGS